MVSTFGRTTEMTGKSLRMSSQGQRPKCLSNKSDGPRKAHGQTTKQTNVRETRLETRFNFTQRRKMFNDGSRAAGAGVSKEGVRRL